MSWLVEICELVLESLGDVCMTQKDSEVAVLLRRPVGALPSGDEDDAVCFFSRQSPLSVAKVWSSGTLQEHCERHDGKECSVVVTAF